MCLLQPVNGGGRGDFVPLPDRGNYDQYHDWLDKLNEQRQAAGRADPPARPVSNQGKI